MASETEANALYRAMAKRHGAILRDIIVERLAQDLKWGIQEHGADKWLPILGEEVGEVSEAILKEDGKNLREELIQVAAVAVAWIEDWDRRQAW